MEGGIEVRRVVFEPIEPPLGDLVIQVSVEASGLVARAVPPVASVGDVPLQRILVLPGERGLLGFLDSEPADGAQLVVGYLGEEPVETDLAYHRGGP